MPQKGIIRHINRNYWMGWAIIMIILCHIQYTCYDDGYIMRCMRLLFKNGEFGVDIFLFLSSIGLSYSIEKNNLCIFYLHRIKRLFPMYFVFLFLSYVFFKTKENMVRDILFQITGVSIFTGNQFNEWYIPALILVYAVFPILYYGISRIYLKFKFYSVLLVIITIYSYIITSDYMTLYFARRLYVVVLGIVIYCAHTNNDSMVSISILSIVSMIQLFVPKDYNMFLFVPLLLVLIDRLCPILPIHGTMSWIGKHSLEIYLGQTLGIIFFCNQSSLRLLYKLPLGLTITAAFSFFLWGVHKLFYMVISQLKKG